MKRKIRIAPIEYVRNEREDLEDDCWGGMNSQIVLNDEIPEDSLEGMESYSHLEIIFHFHRVDQVKVL